MHFPQPGATLPNGIFEFMARDKLDFLSKIVFSPVSLWVKITSKVSIYQMSDNFWLFENYEKMSKMRLLGWFSNTMHCITCVYTC